MFARCVDACARCGVPMAALLVRVRERRTRPMRLTRFDTQASTTSRRKGWRSAESAGCGALTRRLRGRGGG